MASFFFLVAPPLSVDNVMSALEGLAREWEKVGQLLLVPEATREAIKYENSRDVDRLHAVIVYNLSKDPDASWRKLIICLDFSDNEDVRQGADSIRNYAEELSGQSVLIVEVHQMFSS